MPRSAIGRLGGQLGGWHGTQHMPGRLAAGGPGRAGEVALPLAQPPGVGGPTAATPLGRSAARSTARPTAPPTNQPPAQVDELEAARSSGLLTREEQELRDLELTMEEELTAQHSQVGHNCNQVYRKPH
jgi:hypothetical protein